MQTCNLPKCRMTLFNNVRNLHEWRLKQLSSKIFAKPNNHWRNTRGAHGVDTETRLTVGYYRVRGWRHREHKCCRHMVWQIEQHSTKMGSESRKEAASLMPSHIHLQLRSSLARWSMSAVRMGGFSAEITNTNGSFVYNKRYSLSSWLRNS